MYTYRFVCLLCLLLFCYSFLLLFGLVLFEGGVGVALRLCLIVRFFCCCIMVLLFCVVVVILCFCCSSCFYGLVWYFALFICLVCLFSVCLFLLVLHWLFSVVCIVVVLLLFKRS